MPRTATAYQPQLLDPASAYPQPINPENGRSFKLAELYRLLDCQTVEVVRLSKDLILLTDEVKRIELLRKFRSPAYLNLLATYLWEKHQPAVRGQDCIVGRAILCHDKQFK